MLLQCVTYVCGIFKKTSLFLGMLIIVTIIVFLTNASDVMNIVFFRFAPKFLQLFFTAI